MYFRCVFLLLAVAVVRSAFPQNIRRITHRDGLSNSSILSLAQDADGYILSLIHISEPTRPY